MKRFLLSAMLCGVASVGVAQSISLTAGEYAWDNPWGCSDLTIGSALAYTYDAGCDGSVDYTANSVTIEGTRILIDDAYLDVEGADAQAIRGTFHFNGANPAVFVRQ